MNQTTAKQNTLDAPRRLSPASCPPRSLINGKHEHTHVHKPSASNFAGSERGKGGGVMRIASLPAATSLFSRSAPFECTHYIVTRPRRLRCRPAVRKIRGRPKCLFLWLCSLNVTLNASVYTSWCPRNFDGFSCWDETPANAVAVQRCPYFFIGFDPRRYVYKSCTENGTWMVHPESQKPWTNYTSCVDVEDLDFRSVVNNIYVAGYSISVAALLVSLVIFFYFRILQCTRIRIHMHLFTSFALNNVLWIVWYRTVVNSPDVVQNNKVWCQVLHVVTNYFMTTSYFWMFCEGLHLHIALVIVFVKDEVAMRWFMAVGWGASLLVIIMYAVVRYFIPGATERCWMDYSDTFWIIIVPVSISLISSFVFLINVVRVLLTKLNPAPSRHASVAARKAARAALILIPLFGLHFILIPLQPLPGSPGEKLYQVFSALLTSLQGLCVAFLFCFTNHDVMTAMRTQMTRVFFPNEAVPMTGITAGESLVHTRENVL